MLEAFMKGKTSIAEDLVFPSKAGTVLDHSNLTHYQFLPCLEHAGLRRFRFHDLRHTAASWLRMKGADIHTVAQLLGHKDLRMAARYQHLSPAFLADAVAKLDGAFQVAMPALLGELTG